MMRKPRRPKAVRPAADDAWTANIRTAGILHQTMPAEVREFFVRVNEETCDLGERLNIPPRQMAVAAAAIIGGLVLVETDGDVRDDEAIDDFLHYAKAAMHMAVAAMRIANGWTPIDA